MKILKTIFTSLILFSLFFLSSASFIMANETPVLGVHVLHPDELDKAKDLVDPDSTGWQYLTIPFSLEDLKKKEQWQHFFDQAKKKKTIPILRLVTKFENESWKRPNRKELVDMITMLSDLNWPTDKKHIIVFNEVNHANEWGGQIDPASYTEVLRFVTLWAHSEDKNYIVLPAAMDLAAPNGSSTMEAFNYLEAIHKLDPEILGMVDAWNSHSYPNPGFSSSPQRTSKNSLRGFIHELAFLKEKTGRDFQVFITETGWIVNNSTARWLESYYLYALQHIWSHPQIVAVTPFLLKGAPGPFAGFSFLDRDDKPTVQYKALQAALARLKKIESS